MRAWIGLCLLALAAACSSPSGPPRDDAPPPTGMSEVSWHYTSIRSGTTSFGVGTSPQYPGIFRVRVYTGSGSDPRSMVQAIKRRWDCHRYALVRMSPNRREGVFRASFCRPAAFYR